jgi:hypothetical protein
MVDWRMVIDVVLLAGIGLVLAHWDRDTRR